MEIKTLGKRILNISFDISHNNIKKVEKITTFNSTVSSQAKGGGSKDYIDIFGNIETRIAPINISNTVKNTSKTSTRLYFDNSFIMLDNVDFPTIEGNTVSIFSIIVNELKYDYCIKDMITGHFHTLFSFNYFTKNILNIEKSYFIKLVILFAIIVVIFFSISFLNSTDFESMTSRVFQVITLFFLRLARIVFIIWIIIKYLDYVSSKNNLIKQEDMILFKSYIDNNLNNFINSTK